MKSITFSTEAEEEKEAIDFQEDEVIWDQKRGSGYDKWTRGQCVGPSVQSGWEAEKENVQMGQCPGH